MKKLLAATIAALTIWPLTIIPAAAATPKPVSKGFTIPPATQWGPDNYIDKQVTVSGGKTPTKCTLAAWHNGPTEAWQHKGSASCWGPIVNKYLVRATLTCFSPASGINIRRFGKKSGDGYSWAKCGKTEILTYVKVNFYRKK